VTVSSIVTGAVTTRRTFRRCSGPCVFGTAGSAAAIGEP